MVLRKAVHQNTSTNIGSSGIARTLRGWTTTTADARLHYTTPLKSARHTGVIPYRLPKERLDRGSHIGSEEVSAGIGEQEDRVMLFRRMPLVEVS
jgi:hypothetical protein